VHDRCGQPPLAPPTASRLNVDYHGSSQPNVNHHHFAYLPRALVELIGLIYRPDFVIGQNFLAPFTGGSYNNVGFMSLLYAPTYMPIL